MNPLSYKNYYELLEIPTDANRVLIQKAYELARMTFGKNSLATYSIIDPPDREQFMEKIEEAFTVLFDEDKRYQYDLKLGIRQPVKSASDPAVVLPHSQSGVEPKVPLISEVEGSASENKDEGNLFEPQEIKGKVLVEFREKKGIPLQEIANKTRINITYLQFIEQDHYKGLPAEVYLKSYLVQYAKFLGLDPNRVADGYIQMYSNWKKTANPIE